MVNASAAFAPSVIGPPGHEKNGCPNATPLSVHEIESVPIPARVTSP
jgi:hypothetical protein